MGQKQKQNYRSQVTAILYLEKITVFDIFRKKHYLDLHNIKGQQQEKELNRGCPSVKHKGKFKLMLNTIYILWKGF